MIRFCCPPVSAQQVSVPCCAVPWSRYDAVTTEGKLKWQNTLSRLNRLVKCCGSLTCHGRSRLTDDLPLATGSHPPAVHCWLFVLHSTGPSLTPATPSGSTIPGRKERRRWCGSRCAPRHPFPLIACHVRRRACEFRKCMHPFHVSTPQRRAPAHVCARVCCCCRRGSGARMCSWVWTALGAAPMAAAALPAMWPSGPAWSRDCQVGCMVEGGRSSRWQPPARLWCQCSGAPPRHGRCPLQPRCLPLAGRTRATAGQTRLLAGGSATPASGPASRAPGRAAAAPAAPALAAALPEAPSRSCRSSLTSV